MQPTSQSSVVNSAAVSGRLAVNPPAQPDSSLWFSDREIGSAQNGVAPLAYSANDFRKELRRVERKTRFLSVLAIIVALLAILAIVGVAFHIGPDWIWSFFSIG